MYTTNVTIHKKILEIYFSRLLKELRFILPIFFIVLMIFSLFSKNSFDIAKDNEDHLYIGQELLKTNQIAQAEKEFILADADTTPIKNIKAEPGKIKEEIVFWQKVVEEFPNYRDGYLKLAILNYKINRLFDAQKFLNKSLKIDPNSEDAKKIVNLVALP